MFVLFVSLCVSVCDLLVVIEDGAPGFPLVSCGARLAIDAWQGILLVLPRHELDLHSNVPSLTTAKIQPLRVYVEHVPAQKTKNKIE